MVGSALDDFPLASVVISGLITTALIVVSARSWDDAGEAEHVCAACFRPEDRLRL